MYQTIKCAVCNSTCEPVRHLEYNGYTKQHDSFVRALYYNRDFDVDFCCPECSLKFNEDKYEYV